MKSAQGAGRAKKPFLAQNILHPEACTLYLNPTAMEFAITALLG